MYPILLNYLNKSEHRKFSIKGFYIDLYNWYVTCCFRPDSTELAEQLNIVFKFFKLYKNIDLDKIDKGQFHNWVKKLSHLEYDKNAMTEGIYLPDITLQVANVFRFTVTGGNKPHDRIVFEFLVAISDIIVRAFPDLIPIVKDRTVSAKLLEEKCLPKVDDSNPNSFVVTCSSTEENTSNVGDKGGEMDNNGVFNIIPPNKRISNLSGLFGHCKGTKIFTDEKLKPSDFLGCGAIVEFHSTQLSGTGVTIEPMSWIQVDLKDRTLQLKVPCNKVTTVFGTSVWVKIPKPYSVYNVLLEMVTNDIHYKDISETNEPLVVFDKLDFDM